MISADWPGLFLISQQEVPGGFRCLLSKSVFHLGNATNGTTCAHRPALSANEVLKYFTNIFQEKKKKNDYHSKETPHCL